MPGSGTIDPMDDAMVPEGAAHLHTDRLVLRRWRVADAAVLRRLWEERDARVPPHRRIGVDGRPTVEDLADWIRQDDLSASGGLLAVVRRRSGDVIGYCGLIANVHGQDGEPELAYEFLRAEWGRGYATEAARAVIEWARSMGYLRLWATVRDWNIASRHVMSKSGFTETSRVERDAVHGDSIFYVTELPAGHG